MRKVLFILFLSLFYACGGGGSDNNSPNWHQNSSGDWVVMEVFFPDSADGLIPDLLFKTVYASGGIGTEPAQGTIVVVGERLTLVLSSCKPKTYFK